MTGDRFILVTAHGEMSLAEALSYLEAERVDYRVAASSRQVVLLDASGLDARVVMSRLGGLYKLGVVECVLSEADVADTVRVAEKLDAVKFYGWLEEKVRWGVSSYGEEGSDPDLHVFLVEYFKERLRRDGVKKARYVLPRRKEEEEIISDDLVRKKVVDGGLEILAAHISGGYYVGRTLEVVRSQEFIRRDLGRPFQNPKISTPPKIARMLVNLTGVTSKGTLLDPFCGIGTILQEAVVLGLQILGGDIDRRRVSETVRNLKWLDETYNLRIGNVSDRVFTADARRLSGRLRVKVDGVATEPILLPPLKRYPSEEEAKDMLRRSAEIYEEAIPEMARVLKKGGRLALVTPYILTNRRTKATFNLDEVFKDSGLTPYQPSKGVRFRYPLMASAGRDQKVLRGVYVLEKLGV